ncbi:peroxide stress protein YaaA [Glaciimonas sp. PAMC28666]|uniref:peroxide stress protein YaaA n=1 Tax=Glaciimonas sp. PAMC28666 TaxID=2807626 RepID=UPI001963D2B7|nr:peroxide stress protein YaaA [Glaciimonas sp. PAMC28666]QRX83084.1 peroxide stress protein YaaA [Glaciimonas sp. PAMC28666]
MLIVLSPAKSLDYITPPTTDVHTLPDFISRSSELIDVLKKMSPAEVGGLMHISDTLAHLNATRFSSWSKKFSSTNAKQAILAFNGDVYAGFDANSLNPKQLSYTQDRVRILSGLYGMLRPLDLMQPYRLEMGTKLVNAAGKNLYAFWHDTVTLGLNQELAKLNAEVLVNLASDEYFKVVRPKVLQASIVAPVFEDWKNGKYKIISFYAKRARGLMARYATVNKVIDPEQLKDFNVEGYQFTEKDSDATRWVFRRRLAA